MDKIGGITIFGQFFCLTVPKKFVGGTLVFQKCSGIEKFLDNRGITILSKFSCLTVPKNFMGNPSMFQKLWGTESIIGGYQDLPSKIFVSQCRKIS